MTILTVGVITMTSYSFGNIPHWLRSRYLGVNTVWQPDDERNEFSLHTVLKNKECIVSPDGWYKDYAKAISKGIIEENSIQEFVDASEIQNEISFIQVGKQRAFVNYVLVSDEIKTLGTESDNMQLYVSLAGLEDEERVVLINDIKGNMYIVSETEWKKY